jgi:two-component system KDP operon response regulator KdpE
MRTDKIRILAVDDEPRYVRVIRINLEASGYDVLTAEDGATALELFVKENPDLVLLDIMMPNMDGYEVCQRIREFSTKPIIMLTALGETVNKVRGLDLGADDYITKPFSARELMARVRSALRRSTFHPEIEQPRFETDGLSIDFTASRVFVRDAEIKLTPTEYRVLKELVQNAGRVLVPELLLERVWGVGHEGETQLLWQAIHRLRQKIEEDPQNPTYIQTRPGIGYIFLVEK